MISFESSASVKRDSPSHLHRERRHSFGERLKMLLCKQSRRDQYRHLLAVLDCLERGTNGDLRLAVPDVTDHHPVHRNRLLHVGLDLTDDGQLVDGLGEGERVFEFLLPRRVRAERMPRGRLTRSVELNQLTRDLTNRLAGLTLGVRPVGSTELAQRRQLSTDVPGELIERFHRDEQTITRVTTLARRVLDDQVFTTRPADGAFDHLDEPADTVLIVHDHVPGRQREGIDLIAALGRQALSVADRSNAVAGQIGLGDDHHPRRRVVAGEYQSVVQRPAEHRDLSAGRGRSAIEHLGGHFGFTESLDDCGLLCRRLPPRSPRDRPCSRVPGG